MPPDFMVRGLLQWLISLKDITQTLVDTRMWISNHIHMIMYVVIILPCSNFNGGLVKPPLKLWYAGVIKKINLRNYIDLSRCQLNHASICGPTKFIIASFLGHACTPDPDATPPHVIFFLVDDLGMWRHDRETLSASLTQWENISPVTGGYDSHHIWPLMSIFDNFFVVNQTSFWTNCRVAGHLRRHNFHVM